MKRLALAVVVVAVSACGPGGGSGGGVGGGAGGGVGGGAGGGVGGGSGGGVGGGAGGGSAGTVLSVAECEADMDKFVGANCADKGTWSMAKTFACPKIPNISAALCTPALTRAKTCHAQFQQAAVGCTLGSTDSADPCAVDVLLGVLCVTSMNNNQCVGTPCTSSLDCGTGFSCNGKTERCFNTSANCLGLPCTSSLHCPTGQTCNNAAGQCVKN